jgi:hypothetical protein
MCDWRKLLWRVKRRPEIEIADKRLAFSTQTPSIEPSYKTGPKQVKMSISPLAPGFFDNIPRAACSSHRQASQTSLFAMELAWSEDQKPF